MDLLEEIEADSLPKRKPCAVGAFLDAQADDRWEIALAGDRKRYSTSAIHAAMRKRGLTVGAKSVEHHRNGRCSCDRSA